MKKQYFLFSFICILLNAVNAQVSIDKNDMPQPGNIYPKFTYTAVSAASFTPTGANYTWDFSSITSTANSADTFVTVSSTPITYVFTYNNPFDTLHKATAGSPQAGSVPIPTITLSNVYNFYKDGNSRFSQVGIGASINGFPMPLKYDNADVWYNFPLVLGDQDSSVATYSAQIPNLGFFAETKHRHNTVDGWGTLILPHDTFSVMRVKSDLFISDTIYVDTFGFGYRMNRNETEYKWLAKQKGIPVLKVLNRSGVVTVEYFDTTLFSLGVAENANSTIEVYPNPAQDFIEVSSNQLIGEIELYTLTGIHVFSKTYSDVNLRKHISLQELSNGCYYVKCYGKNHHLLATKKIVKIH